VIDFIDIRPQRQENTPYVKGVLATGSIITFDSGTKIALSTMITLY